MIFVGQDTIRTENMVVKKSVTSEKGCGFERMKMGEKE